jgi:hypothetical protein
VEKVSPARFVVGITKVYPDFVEYLLRIGEALANVLERASAAQPDAFIGYFENIDFWIEEFKHLRVVESGYDTRYESMKRVQDEYVQMQQNGYHNLDVNAVPRQRIMPTTTPSQRKKIISRNRDALERIVSRAQHMGLIDCDVQDKLISKIRSQRHP